MQITSLAESGRFDVIIIDAAPTGSTLQLLSFPDIARWYIEKIFPFHRKTVQLARPMVKRMTDMPLPGDEIFDSIRGVGQLSGTDEQVARRRDAEQYARGAQPGKDGRQGGAARLYLSQPLRLQRRRRDLQPRLSALTVGQLLRHLEKRPGAELWSLSTSASSRCRSSKCRSSTRR
jgi:hypothetical protein